MAPVDLDSVLDDLDSDDGNSTTEISNPEEARAETQKVVNLLEQLLLSDIDDQDEDGGTSDGGENGDAGTSGSSSGGAGGGSGGNGGSGGSGGSSGGSSGSSGGSNGGSGGGGSGSSGGFGGSSDSGGSSSSSGGGQGQHQSGAGQPGSNEIAVTIAPTKPPMSAKEIQRAKVRFLSFFFSTVTQLRMYAMIVKRAQTVHLLGTLTVLHCFITSCIE